MKSGGEFWARAAMVAGLAAVVAGLHAAVLRAPGEHLLAGRYVGGIHLWLFWWWPHAFSHGLNPFHTRHLMYPDGVPLAFHTPITEALGGLLVNVFSPAAGLNLTLMALFVLNGLSAFVFLRATPVRRSAAVLGAGIFAFSHYTIVQHGFGQALVNTLYVNPLFAWALLRFRENPDRPAARALVLASAALVLAGPYMAYCFGAMFALGVAGHDALSGRRLFRAFAGPGGRAALAGLSAVAVGALALYFPLWRHYGDWEGGDQRISMVLASFIDMPAGIRPPGCSGFDRFEGPGSAPRRTWPSSVGKSGPFWPRESPSAFGGGTRGSVSGRSWRGSRP